MISKWYELKPQAKQLRKSGLSIRDIEEKLNIPRSTLSGWFKGIILSRKHQDRLLKRWRKALGHAREKAAQWHRAEKTKKLKEAERQALKVLHDINTKNLHVLELTLALLYLGEGTKKSDVTAMGSSDPLLLKFFLTCLKKIYRLDIEKVRADLHLRFDQNPHKMKIFWSKNLNLPLKNFKHVSIDKRTAGKPTYNHYKGVCQLQCGRVDIQRRLISLGKQFCQEIIEGG